MLFLQASELFYNKFVILSHLFFPEQAWAGVLASRQRVCKSGPPQPRSQGLNSPLGTRLRLPYAAAQSTAARHEKILLLAKIKKTNCPPLHIYCKNKK